MVPITIAIPSHNRPTFLRRAIRCVLAQTCPAFELIVLDNGSEDQSWLQFSELRDPRVRTIRHPTNLGIVANWNAAVAAAQADLLCIYHDDDVMHPQFVERMLAALAASPSAGMAFARTRRVDCMGRDLGPWPHPPIDGLMRGADYVLWILCGGGQAPIPSSVVLRREAHAAIGPYGGDFALSSFDAHYYMSVARQFDVHVVGDRLLDYTMHPGQISEHVWRRNMIEGQIDTSLETLYAAASFLTQDDVSDAARRDVAALIAKTTRRLAGLVNSQLSRQHAFESARAAAAPPGAQTRMEVQG